MKGITDTHEIPADIMADAQAVADALATGRPLDPDVARRVRERGAKLTEALRQQHGEMNIAVDLIRAVRDEA